MEFLWIVAVSYLVGSIPNGLLLGKTFWHTDLRQLGSCNIGATNAFRVLGPWPAFWVFLTDAAKGVFGVWLASQMAVPSVWLVAAGIAAIAGHNWSVFLGFKGTVCAIKFLGNKAEPTPSAMDDPMNLRRDKFFIFFALYWK